MLYNIDFAKYTSRRAILLTPNQRLARKLTAESLKLDLDKPYIYSLNDFTDHIINLIQEINYSSQIKILLNQWQREVIFKSIIKSQNDLNSDAVYNKVEQAWVLANDYNLNYSDWGDYPQIESQLFVKWSEQYNQYLNDNNYIDSSAKLDLLINSMDSHVIKLLSIQYIDLYGFDDLTPKQISLFEKLKQFGVETKKIDNVVATDAIKPYQLSIYSTLDEEYYAAASYAKQCYAQDYDKIGIVVPSLALHRKKLIKSFEELLPDRQVWNISGGNPLIEEPVIKSAILWLELIVNQKMSLSDAKYLLRSNYYLKYTEGEKTTPARVNSAIDYLFDELECSGFKEISLTELLIKLRTFNSTLSEVLDRTIKHNNLSISNNNLEPRKLASSWAQIFSEVLYSIAWPGGCNEQYLEARKNNINSAEFQAITQFNSCLSRLHELDKIKGSIKSSDCLLLIKNLLQNTPYQIQTDQNKIDIFGMLEGAGINYNSLWLFNFTSDVWPTAPDPNPFIPIDIQKKHELPQSTAEREFEYASRLTKRYLTSSRDVIVSYNKYDGDKENHLSLLLESYNKIAFESKTAIPQSNYTLEENRQFIKYIKDFKAPEITKTHITAGVKALGLQAMCPYRAFAEVRLNAGKKYKLDIGPAAWLRGQVIHKSLELIFKQYKNKQKLECLLSNPQAYKIYLDEIILNCINHYKQQYNKIFTKGIVYIEHELIYSLIDKWLHFELKRDNFEVVAVEQKYLVTLGKITFNTRVDRVDSIRNSENKDYVAIIDYKTAKQSLNSLMSEDLTDPQLPVYLLIDHLQQANAILFAEVLEENYGFKGIANVELDTEGCIGVDNWDELTQGWHQTIEHISNDFTKGKAEVNPLTPQVCQMCHLDSLCRKDELCHS